MVAAGRGAAFAVALLMSAPALAQPPQDRERTSLAGDVVELLLGADDETEGPLRVGIQYIVAMTGVPYDFPELNGPQFDSSLEAGARIANTQMRETMREALISGMTAEQLRATLAFYRSRQGRAALRSQAEWMSRLAETTDVPEYRPGAAERAFIDSAAGRALAAGLGYDLAPSREGEQQLRRQFAEWSQQGIDLAAADYCARVACGAHQRAFFRRASLSANPRQVRSEHTVWGYVAGDLFPDPRVASLARTACAGDAAGVAAAVQAGVNANARGDAEAALHANRVHHAVTPLLWAIDCGNLAGVEALLAAGADPNQARRFGATLAAGADANQVQRFGPSPVTVAAGSRNPALLVVLLRAGGDPNAHQDESTALQIAFRSADMRERYEDVPADQAWANWDALLAAGADPNRVAPGGQPLAFGLASFDRWEKVEWLLNRGWDGDLVYLGSILEVSENLPREGLREVPQSERDAMQRVRALLVGRGVRFPVGSLMNLRQDARGFYVQP